MAKKCLSEFLGTYVLVATVGFNVLQAPPAAAALSIGASLMVMIYALGGVSGANFNPAVTTTLALTKKLDMSWVAPYMASQIAGGLAAAFFYYGIHGKAFPLGPRKRAEMRTAGALLASRRSCTRSCSASSCSTLRAWTIRARRARSSTS